MKKIVLIIFSLAATFVSQAEDSVRVMRSISLGYQYTEFTGLSPQMQVNLDGGAFVLSANEFTICHRLMFGGEFGGLKSTPSDDQFMSAKVMQGFGYFNFGYLVVDKSSFMLYPYAGIGAVYSGVTLKNKTAADFVDADYTIKSGEKGYFSKTALSFNVGLGLRKNITCSKTDHTMQLGLDLGAHITPTDKDFIYNGSKESVSSFGSSNNIGYYAKFTIGGLMSMACPKMMGCKMK